MGRIQILNTNKNIAIKAHKKSRKDSSAIPNIMPNARNVYTETEISANIFPNKINYGRKRILVDYDEVTPDNVIEVLQKALNVHASNRHDCAQPASRRMPDRRCRPSD